MQPQPSVQEIVQRAQQVFTSDTLKNIVITEVSAGQGPGVVRLDDPKQQVQQSSYTDQHKLWYQAPDKWRTESGSGQDDSDPTVEVSNDGSVWYYFSVGKMPGHVNIQLRENSDKQQGLRHVEERKYDIVMNLGQYYTPTLKGLDTVAGRPSYVVDSGGASAKAISGKAVVGLRSGLTSRHTISSNKFGTTIRSIKTSTRPSPQPTCSSTRPSKPPPLPINHQWEP